MLPNDPKVLILAFLGGVTPSLLWLWFWLKEDKKKPEPKGLLIVIFIIGMAAAIFILPVQKLIQAIASDPELRLVLWAGMEEIIKYLAVWIVLYRTNQAEEPIDWPIYLITVALGFAALENTLFLIKPISIEATTVSLLTGQLRFLGSTLLHTVASGILGIALGLSMHLEGFKRHWHVLVGFALAVGLHSVFNFFIIRNEGSDFLRVFGFLWVVTVIVMILFEKVRRMN